MRAVFTDANSPSLFVLRDAPEPNAGPSDCLVAVEAFSLNPGEINFAKSGNGPARPGWDLAGRVLKPAQDGSGPAQGDRVVGFLPFGAWAEKLAVPSRALAVIPEKVSTETASCLPVAGLTALYILRLGGQLLGRKVLVNAASGAVGHFACALAAKSGAKVVAVVRNPAKAEFCRKAGAHEVVAGDLAGAAGFGPFDLILDPVAGPAVSELVGMLAENGQYVVYNFVGADSFTLKTQGSLLLGCACLRFFSLYTVARLCPPGEGLAVLLEMIARGELEAPIEETDSWKNVAQAAKRQLEHGRPGKIVLKVD